MSVLPATFVHNEDALGGLIQDYARIVSRLKGESDEGQLSVEEAQKAFETDTVGTLIRVYARESSNVLNTPETQVESIFALLLAIFKFLTDEELDLIKAAVKSISESNIEKGVLKLKLLAHIYNSLPVNTTLRYDVYLAIVKVAVKHRELPALFPHIATLPQLLSEWAASPTQARELLLLLAERLTASSFAAEAFTVYIQLLDMLDPTDKNVKTILEKVTVAALSSLHTADVHLVLQTRAASVPKDDKTIKLLRLLAAGDVKHMQQFLKENAALVTQTGATKENIISRTRTNQLASLANQSLRKPVSFTTIARALDIPITEVEIYVIDAIRSNIVMAQINQPRQMITFTRSALGQLDIAQWKDVQAHMHKWKTGLKEVMAAVRAGRESINDYEPLQIEQQP